ncbi:MULTISPECIES: ribonuclease E inhibitor RraB [Novosphingobium]|jgi:regulator of RNase E activity RraB|nr:ribonuclease E inhibitor RraB [Novosphingobium resinovorum]
MNPMLILLFAETVGAQLPSIDPACVEAELAADGDVLRSLNENGDKPFIIRPVDVRFTGSTQEIKALQKAISSLGWRIVQCVTIDTGEKALDVQRDQTTDRDAIRALTETALRLEAKFNVKYDGWGTVATQR